MAYPDSYFTSTKPKNFFDRFLFCYILLIPLTRQVPYHQLISYGATAMLLIIYLLYKLIHQSRIRLPEPVLLLAIGFYLFTVLISTIGSCYKMAGSTQLLRELLFFLIFFLIYDTVRTPGRWHTIVHALIWCGIIATASVLFSAILNIFTGNSLMGTGIRASGLFKNPNVAGLLISICFPVALSYFQWRKSIQKKYAGPIITLITLSTLAAAILTVSRGLILGFFFSFLVLNLDIIKKYRYLILLTVLSVSMLLLIVILFSLNNNSIHTVLVSLRMDRGLSGRDFIWGRAWDVFTTHPLLGTGPNTFLHYILTPDELRPYGTVEAIRTMYFQHGDRSLMHVPGIFAGIISNSAHNLWLDTAANTGLPGVTAVAILFTTYGFLAWRQLKRLRNTLDAPGYWVVKGCFVGLLAFFLRSQFEVSGMLRGALSESLPFWLTLLLVLTAPAPCNRSPANS